MKKKEIPNRLVTMTLAASLAAGSAPLKVNAATEVVSQQSVQNANENTGDISKNAESAEIILEEDESGTVLTTLEEVEEQLNQAFGSELQSAGISVKDWNIYSEVSAIQKRWVPLAGEEYAGTDYPGILAKTDGTCKIGVNRTFGKYDYLKTNPKIEKEFTITIKREPAYETRSLELEFTGNGTVTANSDTLTAGSNDIAKNDVTLTIKPAANQYVKAVFLNGTDITEELEFAQCTGTYTLAGGEDASALKVEFAEAGLKAKESIEPISLLKTEEEDIDYAAVAQDIINKVIDTETSVPQNPQNVTVKYNASFLPDIPVWVPLDEDSVAVKKFGLGNWDIKLSYPGDDRYPASDVTAKGVVEEAGEETQMTLTEGCSVTYAPEEELRQEIYHAVLPQVQTADGTAVSTTIDDFDISFEHTTGDVEVSFRYKGKANEYKGCEGTVLVNIKKARVSVSVESQNIVYGETFKDPIVTTSPEDVDCLTIIGGMDGDAEGFISIKLPQSIKEIGSIGNINIYDAIVKIFGNGIDLNALPEAIDKINELLDLISKVPGAPELGIDFSEIQKILEYLPDNVNAKVYLEKNPSEAGMYVVGAVTTDKNYWTGVGVGFLTVAPKTVDVKLAFNQEMPENNRIPLAEVDNFAFGGKLVDIENQELEANIRTFYSGTSIDGEFHTNTKPIKEEGIYTETIYLLGGNYVALPIVRTYIIGKEPTVVKFDQNSILKTYDGNPAGLTAGVFDRKSCG